MKKILLFLGFLVFYPSAFAAVHSVENISEKVKGDRLSLSDVNSILGTIRGFFFDDSTGFVGVGTDSPAANLEISSGTDDEGDAVLRIEADKNNDNEQDNSWIDFFQDGGKNGMKLGFTGNADNDFVFIPTSDSTQASTPALTVQLDGNIGIGTTSPSTKFEILGDGSAGIFGVQPINDGGSSAIVSTNHNLYLVSDSNSLGELGDIIFARGDDADTTALTELLRVDYDGNVSIGTNAAKAKMHISDNDKAIMLVENPDGGFVQLAAGNKVENNSAIIFDKTGDFSLRSQSRDDFGTFVGDSVKFVLEGDTGNIGIGTTSPAANLEISSGTDGDAVLRIEADENNNSQHEDYNPSIEFFQDGGSHGMKMGLTENAGGTYNSFVFFVTKDGVESTTPALVIEQDGDLQIQGTATAAGTTLTSDARLKNNIKPLPSSLEKVLNLRGISYEWKAQNETSKQIGVVAQEVEAVYPELVHTSESGYKSVSYSKLVAPLIEAVKEIFSITESNADRIAGLEAQIEALRLELDK